MHGRVQRVHIGHVAMRFQKGKGCAGIKHLHDLDVSFGVAALMAAGSQTPAG